LLNSYHLRTDPAERYPRPASPATAADPVGAYLSSITVEGFRGIGPESKLTVKEGPGLTLVVGRNGSGKSSFAEGLEVLLTGNLGPAEDRPGSGQGGLAAMPSRSHR
jgi:AAA domain